MIRINNVSGRFPFFPVIIDLFMHSTSGVQTAENKCVHGTIFICGIIEWDSYRLQYFVVKFTQMTIVPWIFSIVLAKLSKTVLSIDTIVHLIILSWIYESIAQTLPISSKF